MAGKGVVVVTGAGGFIGGHLVKRFVNGGYSVRGADIKPLDHWYQVHREAENHAGPFHGDCRDFKVCRTICAGATEVYHLAADMGGMGFIENNKGLCMISVLINTHLLLAARGARREAVLLRLVRLRLQRRQAERHKTSTPSRKRTPIPRCPKTATAGRSSSASACAATSARTSECPTRVARFHNVYGPLGTWEGGREKAPAAICRKVIEAKLSAASTRSRSGATASRPARSCTSTTASRAST